MHQNNRSKKNRTHPKKASCNHGFASYLGHILYRDALGIRQIDYTQKEVTIRFSDIGINECSGVIPVEGSAIELKWKRINNKINFAVKVPRDFKIKIENKSSAELVKAE